MVSRHNPLRHLDPASQHYLIQVLGWLWSMVFSLSLLSIFQFGYAWLVQILLFGGAAFTVAVFREAAKQNSLKVQPRNEQFSEASDCAWKLDSEA